MAQHASGTIATGGTAQSLFAASLYRGPFYIQNNSTGDLRLALDRTASATAGINIPAGALFETPPNVKVTGTVSIWGATTGQAFDYGEF